MKLEDLGIDPKTLYHDRNLTTVENRFLGILWVDHVGKGNKISANALAIQFYGALHDLEIDPEKMSHRILAMQATAGGRQQLSNLKREVRLMHNHLLEKHSNIPILSKAGPNGGYWIAETKEEAEEFYNTFRQRGLTGLVKAARGRQSALVDMVQQLTFEFEDLVDKTGELTARSSKLKATDDTPMAIEVVDAFLAKMLEDPEKFSEGLRKIGQKYGSVLLPKDQVAEIKAEAAKLQQLVAGL